MAQRPVLAAAASIALRLKIFGFGHFAVADCRIGSAATNLLESHAAKNPVTAIPVLPPATSNLGKR